MGFMKKPKAPEPSAQELAVGQRQQRALDKEVEEQEQRFKALARGKLGSASLLGGAPRSRAEAATGARGARGAGASAGRCQQSLVPIFAYAMSGLNQFGMLLLTKRSPIFVALPSLCRLFYPPKKPTDPS